MRDGLHGRQAIEIDLALLSGAGDMWILLAPLDPFELGVRVQHVVREQADDDLVEVLEEFLCPDDDVLKHTESAVELEVVLQLEAELGALVLEECRQSLIELPVDGGNLA